MTTSEIRRALRRRWYLSLTVLVVAVGVAYAIHQQASTVQTGEATAQILVDSPSSSLVNVNANSAGLAAQASVLAQAMTSNAVLTSIARAARVPVRDITAQGPYSGADEVLDVATPSEARGMQLVSIKPQFHLAFLAQQTLPIITISVTGPTPESAGRMADAVLPGTQAWLGTIAAQDELSARSRLVLRPLGDAKAGYVNSSAAKELAALGAIAVMLFGFLAVVLFDRSVDRRRRPGFGELEGQFAFDPEEAGVRAAIAPPGSDERWAAEGAETVVFGAAAGLIRGPGASTGLIRGRRATAAESLLNGGHSSTDSPSDH